LAISSFFFSFYIFSFFFFHAQESALFFKFFKFFRIFSPEENFKFIKKPFKLLLILFFPKTPHLLSFEPKILKEGEKFINLSLTEVKEQAESLPLYL